MKNVFNLDSPCNCVGVLDTLAILYPPSQSSRRCGICQYLNVPFLWTTIALAKLLTIPYSPCESNARVLTVFYFVCVDCLLKCFCECSSLVEFGTSKDFKLLVGRIRRYTSDLALLALRKSILLLFDAIAKQFKGNLSFSQSGHKRFAE